MSATRDRSTNARIRGDLAAELPPLICASVAARKVAIVRALKRAPPSTR